MDFSALRTAAVRVGAAVAVLAGTFVALSSHRPTPAGAQTGSFPAYWLVASDGGIYQYGTANLGSLRGVTLNRPIVGGQATPDGLGYRMVASDGGVFSFGDARYYGSTGAVRLNKPIVGMATDPVTGGYWLVASDGGIFSFHAPFYGSTGAIRLNRPVVGMAATPDGKGYWLVASDGGIFAFGDARFYGSTGGIRLARPVVGMASGAGGKGYWLAARDGGIFAFGDAHFVGSTGGNMGPAPMVAIMATSRGYPFVPGATGYDISRFQCPPYGQIPSQRVGVPIVQVSGGAINNPPNPCYSAEAAWAGPALSAYIFMDRLPSQSPAEAQVGPAGTCNGRTTCEAYNFGWYWARYWVSYSRSKGYNPSLWWLDVETASGAWDTSAAAQPANAQVIAGAVAGLRSMGTVPGIYSTQLQWGYITGNLVSFRGISIWVPGAGNIDTGTYSARNFCAGPLRQYEPFAGGNVVLVQYGWVGNGYSGPSSPYDLDYACT